MPFSSLSTPSSLQSTPSSLQTTPSSSQPVPFGLQSVPFSLQSTQAGAGLASRVSKPWAAAAATSTPAPVAWQAGAKATTSSPQVTSPQGRPAQVPQAAVTAVPVKSSWQPPSGGAKPAQETPPAAASTTPAASAVAATTSAAPAASTAAAFTSAAPAASTAAAFTSAALMAAASSTAASASAPLSSSVDAAAAAEDAGASTTQAPPATGVMPSQVRGRMMGDPDDAGDEDPSMLGAPGALSASSSLAAPAALAALAAPAAPAALAAPAAPAAPAALAAPAAPAALAAPAAPAAPAALAAPAAPAAPYESAAPSAPGAPAAPPKIASRAMLFEWEDYKRRNNKTYLTRETIKQMKRMFRGYVPADLHSDEDRMNMFMARKASIEEFNKTPKTFRRAINQFADLSPHEVVKTHTGLLLSKRKPRGREYDSRSMGRGVHTLPAAFDWRDRGALTEPRNQASCGCCWAFAATAVMEAKNFIRTQTLVPLSEQNLLDCDTLNEKCDGGTPWDAFDWLQSNGGQEEYERYPYEVMPDTCRQDPSRLVRFQVRGYMIVRPSVEENIMGALLSEGPLTIAVNANPITFQDYREGVYSDAECTAAEDDLKHAVVLVGYGDDPEGGPYWTVRNSWGREWGEGGYIRISRANNLCGVMTYAVFPSVE